MRNWFRKYWQPLLICAIVLLGVLSFAVLVQSFKSTNCLAAWLFNFINDWAIILYASITFLLAIAAFWGIREARRERLESRRLRALERIRNWAENIDSITDERTSRAISLQERLADLDRALSYPHSKGFGILNDAIQIGGEVKEAVKSTCFDLSKFIARIGDDEDIKDFKEIYEEEVTRIKSNKEFVDAERELFGSLAHLIEVVTKELVPEE